MNLWQGIVMSGVLAATTVAAQQKSEDKTAAEAPVKKAGPDLPDSTTEGTVTVGGQAVAYKAVAGILTVGATDSQDAMLGFDGQLLPNAGVELPANPQEQPPTAHMFYTAYFKKSTGNEKRPITFLYNGGPGSSTMWLHMGSVGPRRVVTTDTKHDEGAPYKIVNNDYSLLDVTDLVFIDAPGTGFSRIKGKNKEKAFWGTDQDAHAFERFIRRFLTKYDRWNSPKYLFGESYGTTRSAVLSSMLQNVDLNGIVLLSQILSFDNTADGPELNPGTDLGYITSLPSFAATAWYHKKVPSQPADLQTFLREVEHYATNDYALALLKGSDLPEDQRHAVAQKLNSFTGIPVEYWERANLRISGGEFSRELQLKDGLTTGRLDSRYEGPAIMPLDAEADYDPFTNSIGAAYTTAINSYVRNDLKFGEQMTYLPSAYSEPGFDWELRHKSVVSGGRPDASVNVMHDLAASLKANPGMKVLLMGGYFDLGTTYFGAQYEMKHLPMPNSLQKNISYKFFPTGHMVYINEEALKGVHETVSNFIHATESGRE